MTVGTYRWFEGRDLGWGRVLESPQADSRLRVSFFDAPESEEEIILLPVSSMGKRCRVLGMPWSDRQDPWPQTRVYVQDEAGSWRMGRLKGCDQDGRIYRIRFPNDRNEHHIEVERVRIRRERLIHDPSPRLAERLGETQLFLDRRRNFVHWLHMQRNCSLGMPGVLSSSIRLVRHQIETAYTVLADPIQRYLLADEVGLGKTIEAGIIIRQRFLDDPEGMNARILVPEHLVGQWEREMRSKFHLDRWIDSFQLRIEALSASWTDKPAVPTEMLIVDEAHCIVADAAIFDRLRAWSARTAGLLLLSATPVLNNEEAFLRMLCLLDPQTYAPEDLDTFRQRVQQRQTIAEVVNNLPNASGDFLLDDLDEVTRLLPNDEYAMGQVRNIRRRIERGEEEIAVAKAHALALYISEIYRIHRRFIRHRRKALGVDLPLREGVGPRIEYHDPVRERLEDILDHWKNVAERTHPRGALGGLFVEMLEALDEHPIRLQRIIERITSEAEALPGSDILEELRQEVFEESDAKVDALVAHFGQIIRPFRPYLRNDYEQKAIVVFCGEDDSTDRVLGQLKADRRLGGTVGDGRQAEHVRCFVQTDRRYQILVCGRDEEVGLNLQGRKGVRIFHLSLPWDPVRIEQRIGRIDRFGQCGVVHSGVFVPARHDYLRAWFDVLNDGLDIFRSSIAPILHVVQSARDTIKQRILREGMACLSDLKGEYQGAEGVVAKERRSVETQDVIDSCARNDDAQLFDLHRPPDKDAKHFRNWCGLLRFKQRRNQYEVHQNSTLMGMDRLMSFDGALHFPQGRAPHTDTMVSFHRHASHLSCGLARVGHPFVDALARDVRWDDRGMVAATWRRLRDYSCRAEGFDTYFRIDITIELPVERGSSDELVQRRRADALFPPEHRTIHLDENLEPIADERTRLLIDLPYDKKVPFDEDDPFQMLRRFEEQDDEQRRDRNISGQNWERISTRIGPEAWRELVTTAKERALELCMADTEIDATLQTARSQLARTRATHRAIHEGRMALHGGNALPGFRLYAQSEALAYEKEEKMEKALLQSLETPSFRVDSMLAMFLTTEKLP